MMSALLLLMLAVAALGALLGGWMLYRGQIRSAADVCVDLAGRAREDPCVGGAQLLSRPAGVPPRAARIVPVSTALSAACVYGALAAPSAAGICSAAACAWGAAYLLMRAVRRSAAAAYRREVEYHLPMVMERLVMAVEAGLDIVAAVAEVVQLERESECDVGRQGSRGGDPVTRLLETALQLAESGLRFEAACAAAAEIECPALKHAFVHIALAQKEGGELAMPLRELSDATQLYYQETVEEEIAALPVKATLPLVCTFAGLIICFITAPLMQVMKITGQAVLH